MYSSPAHFRHLLVPLDGTPMAEAVLPVVVLLARKLGASVTLLHILEHSAPQTVHGAPHLSSARTAEQYLQSIAEKAFPKEIAANWHVHVEGVKGLAQGLADHVGELHPDLTIMLTHGVHAVRDALLGNLAQQVVRSSLAPVLLFHPGPGRELAFPFKSILVPLDGRPEHEAGVAGAVTLTLACNAELRLLSVVPTLRSLQGSQAVTGELLPSATQAVLELAEREAAEYLSRVLARVRERIASAHACVARGGVVERTVETAEETQADLLVLATHGRSGTAAFWAGSVAQKLMRRLPVAFLIVRAGQTA